VPDIQLPCSYKFNPASSAWDPIQTGLRDWEKELSEPNKRKLPIAEADLLLTIVRVIHENNALYDFVIDVLNVYGFPGGRGFGSATPSRVAHVIGPTIPSGTRS